VGAIQAGLGGDHVGRLGAALHLLELGERTGKASLGGVDVLRTAAGLDRRQLGLRRGQARLGHRDLLRLGSLHAGQACLGAGDIGLGNGDVLRTGAGEGLLQLRLGGGQVGLRLLLGELEVGGVQAREHLAGGDGVAHRHVDLRHASGGAEAEHAALYCGGRAGSVHAGGDVAPRDLSGLGGDGSGDRVEPLVPEVPAARDHRAGQQHGE
jgi:hypothetical protein